LDPKCFTYHAVVETARPESMQVIQKTTSNVCMLWVNLQHYHISRNNPLCIDIFIFTTYCSIAWVMQAAPTNVRISKR